MEGGGGKKKRYERYRTDRWKSEKEREKGKEFNEREWSDWEKKVKCIEEWKENKREWEGEWKKIEGEKKQRYRE